MMGKRKPYVVAGITFRTQRDLREHIQEILYANPPGQHLDPHDFKFMRALLERHQGAVQKIGCGIAALYVRKNPIYGNLGFWLIRTDGTETDFSFVKCLRHRTKLQQFKAACRAAVADTVIQFKLEYFAQFKGEVARCPLAGGVMTIKTSHVDHAPPMTFDRIVIQFIDDRNLDMQETGVAGIGVDGAVRKEIADEQLREDFILYHNRLATLRVISARANLSLVR